MVGQATIEQVKVKKRKVTYYPAEEMGTMIGGKAIQLFDSFFWMIATNNLGLISARARFAEVGCPFCEDGYLMLVGDEPQFSLGPAKKEDKAMQLRFVCSNCPSRFVASYHWLLRV